MVLAFDIIVTLLVNVFLFGTRCIKRPVFLHSAIQAVITVFMGVAAIIFLPAQAHLLFAVTRQALIGVSAEPARKKILPDTNNLGALCRQLLVFKLTLFRLTFKDSINLILLDSSPELLHPVQFLLDPRVLSVLGIEFAEGHILLLVCLGLVVALACKHFLIDVLTLHEEARIFTDGIHLVDAILRITN